MLKKNLLLTFDYELYLGINSGECEESLIKPTQLLLDLLNKHNLKGIFFVDTLYLNQLENHQNEPKIKKHLIGVRSQLVGAIKSGHYIFPHIHPHWLEAGLNSDKCTWNLHKLSKYRFHNINENEKVFAFKVSMNIIHDLYKMAEIDPKNLGYRAGGWCIQPFSDFEPFFQLYNIKHDFSVLPGFCNEDNNQFFDFKNCREKSKYKFMSTNILSANRKGDFIEWPISTLKYSKTQKLINKIFDKILWKLKIRAIGKGQGAKLRPNKSINDSEMISIELLTRTKLNNLLRHIDLTQYIHFITHPKMVSHHNLKTFELLLKRLNEKYDLESDFNKINKYFEN